MLSALQYRVEYLVQTMFILSKSAARLPNLDYILTKSQIEEIMLTDDIVQWEVRIFNFYSHS